METEWKQIEGFNYKVNNRGDVINLRWNKKVNAHLDKGKLRVTLSNKETKKRHHFFLAQLVYHYFISPVKGKTHISFRDGNKYNCNANNLMLSPSKVRKKLSKMVKESQMDNIKIFESLASIPYADNCTVKGKSYSNYWVKQSPFNY